MTCRTNSFVFEYVENPCLAVQHRIFDDVDSEMVATANQYAGFNATSFVQIGPYLSGSCQGRETIVESASSKNMRMVVFDALGRRFS